ncbi:MAG TPA: hypothetical protein VMV86_03295, partial [Methanosarcinales archaeon]|nr:hypothetical protein [Methanosarcinales archaeon]
GSRNSRILLNGKISSKLKRLKAELQQAELFLSQCCGYRWTNEVNRLPEVRQPQRQPQQPQRGLLGVEAEPVR